MARQVISVIISSPNVVALTGPGKMEGVVVCFGGGVVFD